MTEYQLPAVARFAADWESTLRGERPDPPPLEHYVPDGQQARLGVLTALVRVDVRQRCRRSGLEKRIAEYRSEFPEVSASPEFVDLVCEEYLVRSRYRPLDVDTFSAEYPEVAGEILRRFAAGEQAAPAVPPTLPEGIEAGRRLDDFDLLTELGGVEHSRMFLARQRSMQRLVAVRVEAGADSDTPTVAQLDHQHIVRVFDQRLLADGGGGKPLRLLYMQYLPGGSAAGVLTLLHEQRSAPGGGLLLRAVDSAMAAKGEIPQTESRVRAELAALSWPETVAWVGRRLAVALDYADRQGVRHHDIRPANVLFTAEGVPKLADFALGPLYWNAGPQGTHGAAADDPAELRWSSPEALAARLDPTAALPDTRSDIYSLGVLLWELLTGAAPFVDPPVAAATAHETVTDMLARRRAGVPDAALNALPADTPAALRRVLLECLHPDPAQRRQSGAELAGQLDLCLDARARDLVDPPPKSLRARARGWPVPVAVCCVLLPNLLASVYNIKLNQSLIVDRLAITDQHRFETVVLITNLIAFPLAALLLLWLARRPLTVSYRLAHGRRYAAAELAQARADTLLVGERAVWVPFGMWVFAGLTWMSGLKATGVHLPPMAFGQFIAAQMVCAAMALSYPFFLISVYAVRSLYPRLLARGTVGPADRAQLWRLARRSNVYLAVAASVPLLGVATATFVSRADLALVIVPVRWLSVGGVVAFVLTYWLFRRLDADLRALMRAIPQGAR